MNYDLPTCCLLLHALSPMDAVLMHSIYVVVEYSSLAHVDLAVDLDDDGMGPASILHY